MPNGIEIKFAESDDPLMSGVGASLREYEARIKGDEADSLEARWQFGRVLLGQRQGKQLPKGFLEAVRVQHGLSQSEISRRMRFAEAFPTKKELSHAVTNFGSWRRICSEALPKKQAPKPKPRKPTFPFDRLAVRRWTKAINSVNRDQVEAEDPGMYAEIDRLYDALVAFFNGATGAIGSTGSTGQLSTSTKEGA